MTISPSGTTMAHSYIPLDITHHQDSVVELFLDEPNRKVIELHHRAGGREDRIEHSAEQFLLQFAGYPRGQKVLQAMVST